MGRAGSGSSHRSHSSSHHSSSHRSTSSHRVSSSRPSSGSSHSRAGGGYSGGFHSSPHYHHSHGYGPHYGHHHTTVVYNDGPAAGFGFIIKFFFISFALIFLLMFAVTLIGGGSSSSSIPASTQNRTKLDTGIAYQNDCIVDEIGWFDNIPNAEKRLQYFYKETGVQPYVVLFDYIPELTSDSAQEAYAEQWYTDNIKDESTFLFAYFAEKDVDNDVGNMVAVNGKQISSVMDAEAIEIFWAYIDQYWYSDMSTDDLFVTAFTKTADRIMTKSTTALDVGKIFGWVILIATVFGGVIAVIRIRRKNEKERNEETERILNTPLEQSSDDVLNKYNK